MDGYINATERWLPVPGYEGEYEVSDQGRVRSLDRYRTFRLRSKEVTRFWPGKILKPFVSGRVSRSASVATGGKSEHAYLYVELTRPGGERLARPVHRLVALAFLGEPQPGQEVCHGDQGRMVNTVENLRWGTRSENSHDALRDGTHVAQVRGK